MASARDTGKRPPRRATLAALLLTSCALLVAHLPELGTPSAAPPPLARRTDGGFAGSDACRPCHPGEHASWQRSYHRSMTQLPDQGSVLGDFDGVELELDGSRYLLSRTGSGHWISGPAAAWAFSRELGLPVAAAPPTITQPIELVTGSHHHQVYWVSGGAGNQLLALPFTWLVDEARWVPRRDTFLAPPGAHHFTPMWNTSCVFCHVTGGQPRATHEPLLLETRIVEPTIGCESCHGPGQRHVDVNRNPLRRYAHHAGSGADDSIVNPARLDPIRASQVCGQCHALLDRFAGLDPGFPDHGTSYRPGLDLHLFSPLERADASAPHALTDSYWPDGECRVAGREYNAMLASACVRGGLSCLSCHSMHSGEPDDQLRHARDSDETCSGCHAAESRASTRHTHHAEDSPGNRCVNCHMPHTSFGLLRAMRSHRISAPSVEDTLRTGRPNACNLCHLDRTLAWTGEWLSRWYRQPLPQLDERGRQVAASAIWLLAGDAMQRAVVAWHFGWWPARSASGLAQLLPVLRRLLTDPYAAVRHVATRALRQSTPAELAQPGRDESSALDPSLVEQLLAERDHTPIYSME